jgi:tyrocidine synthetase-3
LADGYLNLPELTASKFVTNPFPGTHPTRLYRTGDLGKCLPDGTIQYTGRKDDQVKIRGYRVEPAEIVASLKKHPALRDAVVLASGGEDESRRLVAYIVCEKDHEVSRDDLRTHLLGMLPEYMVPSDFVFLAEVPLLASGKVDRRALPKLARLRSDHNVPFVGPRNDTEKRVAEIVAETVGVGEVGINDTFFDLGGNSLAAMGTVLRISKEFGVELSVRQLFDSLTVRGLAAIVAQSMGNPYNASRE